MRKIVTILGLVLVLSTLGFGVDSKSNVKSREVRYREAGNQIKLFGEVFKEVNGKYVDSVDLEELIEAAIKGMLGTLDPYTVYFEVDNVEELEIIAKGEYGGVGIEIGLRGEDKALTVISPIDDTPAARKGLKAGDVISAVDGKSTKGFSTSDAAKVIRGPKGTDVILTIIRSGFDEPMDYTLTRDAIRVHDVNYFGILEGTDIGYVKLSRFSTHAGDELNEALKQMMAEKPSGLILDLRSNPGGLLPSAVEVARQFLEKGDEIVYTDGRTPRSKRRFKASGMPMAADIPLIVMVNRGSASASEIVAGAIQDHDRGIVLGTPTFGKGLVQTVRPLPNGAALKITTARYYTPSGRLIQKDLTSHKESDDSLPAVSGEKAEIDTTKEMFYTDNGRVVYGGGGIVPDLEIKQDLLDRTTVEMYRRDFFFQFVQDWVDENGPPESYVVSEEMLDLFSDYVQAQEFTPQSRAIGELDALREIGKTDSLDDSYFSLLDEVEQILRSGDTDEDMIQSDDIRRALEIEMASFSEGLHGRIEVSLKYDVQLARAIEILQSPEQHSSILKGTGRADAVSTGKSNN